MTNGFYIFLVEDDFAQAKLFQFTLKKKHPEVTLLTFESGGKLLEHVDKQNVVQNANRIVLSDLNLPDMTGIELLDALKKTKWGDRVRFILFTQIANPEITEKAYSAGAAAILTKADSYDEFESLVVSLVGFWSLNKI